MQTALFNLDVDFKDPLQNQLFSMVKGPIEQALEIPRLNRFYDDVSRMDDNRPFPDRVLERLGVSYDISATDRSRITIPTGAVIVVANHPFGGVETVILASILRSMRRDVKLMANYLLNAIPEIQDLLITVDPFQGATSVPQQCQAGQGKHRLGEEWRNARGVPGRRGFSLRCPTGNDNRSRLEPQYRTYHSEDGGAGTPGVLPGRQQPRLPLGGHGASAVAHGHAAEGIFQQGTQRDTDARRRYDSA